MHEDLDDTVIAPVRRRAATPEEIAAGVDEGIDEDTVITATAEAQHTSTDESTSERDARELVEGSQPALIELVTPVRQRRVPLTHQRLRESLRTAPVSAGPASVAASLLATSNPHNPHAQNSHAPASPVHDPPALVSPASVSAGSPSVGSGSAGSTSTAPTLRAHSFRIGDRAPISLDVPALVGRHPAAPRIPGKQLPRLVRVSSPLSEVSGTHLRLHQEGSSVIVTDLRSTNGTVVRMPGARPLKLRQGESVVVRPGTLVDIGDGNVLEILPPPRLTVPSGTPGERPWQ